MRRAWAVTLTGTDGLQLPGTPHYTTWTTVVASTWRDKGLARLVASGYCGGGRVQRVSVAARHATKQGSRHPWIDTQDPIGGISRRRLRRILIRRASFGGRKGRRAAKRLKEMYQ